ncbi:hypothetical protein [Cupriavidus sp. 8B]
MQRHVPAGAAGIPFATNRPQTWQFSSDFTEPYSSFGQNLQWNNDTRTWDSQGYRVASAGTDTFVGLSSLLRYRKIDGHAEHGLQRQPRHHGRWCSVARGRDTRGALVRCV